MDRSDGTYAAKGGQKVNGTFNINEFVQTATMKKQWHEQEATKGKAAILQLEERVGGLYEMVARHEGAAGAVAEQLQLVQRLLVEPGNPMQDPLAASDQ